MPGKTLVVLGSGPGIGTAVASNFSVRGFTHVALVSRDSARLKQDQDKVLDTVQERGYSCQVKTWTCDLANFEQLDKTLKEVEGFGTLECVLFNAARVAGGRPLEEKIEDIEQDFRVSTLLTALERTAVAKLANTVDELGPLQNGSMGSPASPAEERSRRLAFVLRHKHDATLQGAGSGSRLSIDGQIGAAGARVVVAR